MVIYCESMGRSRRWRTATWRTHLAATVLVGLLLVPAAAWAMSFGQARSQLRAWHLAPRPLFPSRLPAAHAHVNVHLYRFQGVDYVIDFGAGNTQDCHTIPNPNTWCVQLRGFHGAATPPPGHASHVSRMRIGNRHVYLWYDEGNAGGWWMTWSEHGRSYALWAWLNLDQRGQALARLRPFIRTLHTL